MKRREFMNTNEHRRPRLQSCKAGITYSSTSSGFSLMFTGGLTVLTQSMKKLSTLKTLLLKTSSYSFIMKLSNLRHPSPEPKRLHAVLWAVGMSNKQDGSQTEVNYCLVFKTTWGLCDVFLLQSPVPNDRKMLTATENQQVFLLILNHPFFFFFLQDFTKKRKQTLNYQPLNCTQHSQFKSYKNYKIHSI